MLTSSTSCCALWHNRRRSILTSRQHLVGEAEAVLCDLPLDSQSSCRTSSRSNRGPPRSPAATAVDATTPTRLRLQLLDGYRTQIAALDLEEQHVVAQLRILFRRSGSTLGELCGLSTRSVAELLVEIGDPRRFTECGFARFNGSAPLPASTAERPGEPIRHRYSPGGNRRVNSILYMMAVTQLRCEPRARVHLRQRTNPRARQEGSPQLGEIHGPRTLRPGEDQEARVLQQRLQDELQIAYGFGLGVAEGEREGDLSGLQEREWRRRLGLEAIAVCLIDVTAEVQAPRLTARGDDPALLMHHRAFADWMRHQARGPLPCCTSSQTMAGTRCAGSAWRRCAHYALQTQV